MNDDLFGPGFMAGCLFAVFLLFILYHIGESRCQREHNVADCVMIEDPFVPYETERAG